MVLYMKHQSSEQCSLISSGILRGCSNGQISEVSPDLNTETTCFSGEEPDGVAWILQALVGFTIAVRWQILSVVTESRAFQETTHNWDVLDSSISFFCTAFASN